MTVSDPQSFNRYTYVNNDPVNQVDPLGLMEASAGWGSVSNGFWGHDLNDSGSHFGGPAALGEALMRHDGRVAKRMAELRKKKSEPQESNSKFQDDSTIDPDDVVRIPSQPAFPSEQDYKDYFDSQFGFSLATGGTSGFSRSRNPYPGLNEYRPKTPDFKAFNFSISILGPLSIDLSATRDKYSQDYLSLGPGLGAAPIAVSVVQGNVYIEERNGVKTRAKTAREMQQVLEGYSRNFTFGAGLVMGSGQSLSGPGFTDYFGLGTPQIGINYMFSMCLNCRK